MVSGGEGCQIGKEVGVARCLSPPGKDHANPVFRRRILRKEEKGRKRDRRKGHSDLAVDAGGGGWGGGGGGGVVCGGGQITKLERGEWRTSKLLHLTKRKVRGF